MIARQSSGRVGRIFGAEDRRLTPKARPPHPKNVAGVLVAAAFEDTIRKLAAAFADVHDRRDLADVLAALRAAKVLEGATFATAQNYLNFRNSALHANWDRFSRPDVLSCRAFVEQLILQHFAQRGVGVQGGAPHCQQAAGHGKGVTVSPTSLWGTLAVSAAGPA